MTFLKIDRELINSRLSARAILCYALLSDRLSLSKANGWQDNNGYYIIYSYSNLAEALGIKRCRTIRIVNELRDAGLIQTVRTANNCNKIYVLPVPEGFGSSAPADTADKIDIEKLIDSCAALENVYLDTQKRQEVLERVLPRIKTAKNKVGYIRSVLRNWKPEPESGSSGASYDIELYDRSNSIVEWNETNETQ